MNNNAGINFGDLKKQERYKRLERDLKLAFVQQIERVKASDRKAYCTSPTWPSLSSINVDGLDSSGTNNNLPLQVSRVESEVVSSSSNLRNVLPMHKKNINQISIATSSVKKFPINKSDEDCIIMPPPSSSNFKPYKTKGSSNINSLALENVQPNKIRESDIKVHELVTSSVCSSNLKHKNVSSMLDSQESKGYRTFSNWRVLLNEQGQLIIKGTLECGKIARSKPVVRRFTNTQVQSIFKHIYVLDGHIVDDRNELPDYVKGKFHNGFPDDWENVYQLWRKYVTEGSNPMFRWPVPITDSDDDLNSDITEFVYLKNKPRQSMEEAQFSKFSYNISSSGYHSKIQSESNQNLDKSTERGNDRPFTDQNINKHVEDNSQDNHSSLVKDTCTYNEECKMTNYCKENSCASANISNSTLKNTSFLYEIIQEDKLRMILSSLGDKNCPPQYLDKFIEMIDCLRFILSYIQDKNTETNSSKDNALLATSQSLGCKNCNNTSCMSETKGAIINENVNLNSDKNNGLQYNTKNVKQYEQREYAESTELKNNLIQNKSDNTDNNINEISANEVYMGIPNLNLHQLIHNKCPRPERYPCRRTRLKDRKNIQNEENGSITKDQKHDSYSSSCSSDDQQDRKYQENKSPYSKKRCSNRPFNKYMNKNSTKENDKPDEILLTPTKITSTLAVKQLPTVKSSVPVNINLKRSLRNQINTDVSFIEDEVPQKIQKTLSVGCNNSNDKKEEHFSEDVQKHPFLTYDSEDFLSDEQDITEVQELDNSSRAIKNSEVPTKTTSENRISRKSSNLIQQEVKNKIASDKDVILSNQVFGSKENPKQLASWIPCVVYSENHHNKFYLIFEGKLLNEAGHILHRKYTTDYIHQRHSSKLVETVNKEFFLLIGEINDSKHVIPKQLLKYCRSGCPSDIMEFCVEWQKLSVLEKNTTSKIEHSHDTSIDMLMIPTSSRGRKIIPPLNYWNGERVLTKDNETVYEPGHLKENTSLKKIITSKEAMIINEGKTKQNSKETKTIKDCNKKSLQTLHSPGSQKAVKKRIIQKLKYSSDSDNSTDNKKIIVPQTPKETNSNIKLRRRTRNITQESSKQNVRRINLRSQEKPNNMLWSLDKEQYNDILSDDQKSVLAR